MPPDDNGWKEIIKNHTAEITCLREEQTGLREDLAGFKGRIIGACLIISIVLPVVISLIL